MKFRQLITAASITILPLAASAATFIVPAAGTGPGANDSRWQSELTLHNTSATPTTIGLTFHDGSGAQSADSVSLNARTFTSTTCGATGKRSARRFVCAVSRRPTQVLWRQRRHEQSIRR